MKSIHIVRIKKDVGLPARSPGSLGPRRCPEKSVLREGKRRSRCSSPSLPANVRAGPGSRHRIATDQDIQTALPTPACLAVTCGRLARSSPSGCRARSFTQATPGRDGDAPSMANRMPQPTHGTGVASLIAASVKSSSRTEALFWIKSTWTTNRLLDADRMILPRKPASGPVRISTSAPGCSLSSG